MSAPETYQPMYPNKFKAGDIAISKKFVKFLNGEKHTIGQEILVFESTKSYYNVNHKNYELKDA